MEPVRDRDVAWLRQRTALLGTLRYAIPAGFEAYGVLDLPEETDADEDVLLDTLTVGPTEPLVAGWIDRGPWPPPDGDEHVLYTGWRHRLRRVEASDLRGLPTEGEGGFPDLLFPLARSWLVSLLWDDSWRSVGTSRAVADRLAQRVPNFAQLRPDRVLAETGRVPN